MRYRNNIYVFTQTARYLLAVLLMLFPSAIPASSVNTFDKVSIAKSLGDVVNRVISETESGIDLWTGISNNVEDYPWSSWREYLSKTLGNPPGMCDVQHVFSRYDRTNLEELILLPIEDDCGILDVDAEVGKKLSDEDLSSLLFQKYGIDHPLSLQNMEKIRRNEIINYLKSAGGGIRQLSRLTGLSLGLIQKL